MKKWNTMWRVVAALVMGALLLAGCREEENSNSSTQAGKPVFRILAGSELKDVEPKVKEFADAHGVVVKFDFTGSLDAVDRLSEPHQYDAVWLSHGKYPQLVAGVRDQVKSSEKTMYSRVVLGVKPEKARELGWADGKVSWKDVLAASKAGKFRFAMTNPAGSNSGFVTLVGVASELSGKGDALEASDIPEGQLKDFFKGMTMTSGSSGDLADKFLAGQAQVDGIVNYESVLETLRQKGVALTTVVPKEGVITADYPLMLLKRSQQGEVYQQLVTYLRAPETQKWLAQMTHRTPLTGGGDAEVTNELPFPGKVSVVDAILRGYLDAYAKPSSSYFVLDVSLSMEGKRIADLKRSMEALASGDGSVSGRFSTFRDRELVSITPFAGEVYPAYTFELSSSNADNAEKLKKASAYVKGLELYNATAIYDGVLSVYAAAQAELRKGNRSVSIVLMTDGENNTGAGLGDYLKMVQSAGEPKVPVYGILYGEADADDMAKMVAATGGKVFDARKQSLKQVLKSIRAYQ